MFSSVLGIDNQFVNLFKINFQENKHKLDYIMSNTTFLFSIIEMYLKFIVRQNSIYKHKNQEKEKQSCVYYVPDKYQISPKFTYQRVDFSIVFWQMRKHQIRKLSQPVQYHTGPGGIRTRYTWLLIPLHHTRDWFQCESCCAVIPPGLLLE